MWKRQPSQTWMEQPHGLDSTVQMELLNLGHRFGRRHDDPLGKQPPVIAQPILQVAVAVDGAEALRLGMIDERPFDPMSIHFNEQLMTIPTR